MLQRVMQNLKGDSIVARDGELGSVQDVYFDDERWAVRYLVVDTGNWLPGRQVLLSPASVADATNERSIHVNLTREQVKNAPETDEHPPVSRLYEQAHANYYGYPPYWAGPYLWGAAALPLAAPPAELAQTGSREREEQRDMLQKRAEQSHLRSGAEVIGYRIRASDGEIGHVEDFVVDDKSWAVADMVVDTRNWLPGKKVLVPPSAIEHIDWSAREVIVRMKREELRAAPQAH